MNPKFLLLLGICLSLRKTCSRRVQTTHGPIESGTVNLFNGKSVDAFLGIPYAAPPIKENRFAPPQPLKPWTETLYATSFSNTCLQAVNDELRRTISYVSDSKNESEDCLYLNVWRPSRNTTEKLAVMIWIHGGGFFSGSTTIPMYNGEILASENDVIVASMDYRLSAFGFLYLNSTEVPGNAGLQDQIQAMSWIKANAEAFGGDPTRITIFGQSAGSISVASHLANPKLYNLFERGIMMSGSIDLVTLSMAEALNNSLQLAENLRCPVDSAQQALDCLRTKPVTDFFNNQQDIPSYIRFPYSVVRNGVESPVDTTYPARNVSPRKRKDLMGGNIPDENNYFITSFFPGKVLNEDFTVTEADLRDLLGIVFQISDKRLQNIIMHEYGINSERYKNNQFRNEAISILTDFAMICPQINFTEEWLSSNNHVYYYNFEHRPSKAVKLPLPKWAGAAHDDEIPFVFGLPLDPKKGYTVSEMKLSKNMMNYWSNFAKTGDPNGIRPEKTNWPTLGQKPNMTYIRLDENITLSHSLKEKECAFWREIFPLLVSIQEELQIP